MLPPSVKKNKSSEVTSTQFDLHSITTSGVGVAKCELRDYATNSRTIKTFGSLK